MQKKYFIIGLLSLLVAFNVNAKDAKKNPQLEGYRVKFKEIDKKGKGYIEEKEYVKYHGQQWKLLDKEKVEIIDKETFMNRCQEIGECPVKYKAKAFEEIDFNNDGKVTKKEYKMHRHMKFMKMDKKNDGKVTEQNYVKGETEWENQFKVGNTTVKEEYKAKVK